MDTLTRAIRLGHLVPLGLMCICGGRDYVRYWQLEENLVLCDRKYAGSGIAPISNKFAYPICESAGVPCFGTVEFGRRFDNTLSAEIMEQ